MTTDLRNDEVKSLTTVFLERGGSDGALRDTAHARRSSPRAADLRRKPVKRAVPRATGDNPQAHSEEQDAGGLRDGHRRGDAFNERPAGCVLVAQCRELLARRRARTGLSGRVRDVLVARLSDPPDADEVADLLHVGSRTLRHRLAAEDTSYRALLSEVREHMAEELLITAGLPVEQIARRLGYVEVSSFSQAFRRWKGVGPREYRKQHPATSAGSAPQT